MRDMDVQSGAVTSAMRMHGGVRRWTSVLDMTTGHSVHVTG